MILIDRITARVVDFIIKQLILSTGFILAAVAQCVFRDAHPQRLHTIGLEVLRASLFIRYSAKYFTGNCRYKF